MHPKFEVRGLPAVREHGRRQAAAVPATSTPFQLDGPVTVTQVKVVFATGDPPASAPVVTPSSSSSSSTPPPALSSSSSSSSSVVAAATPSASPIVSPTPSGVVAIPSPTPSFATDSDTQNPASPSGNLGKSTGLSSGAIAGVVTALLLVALGVLVFFVRKRFISQRQKKRGTWAASLKQPGEKGISNLTPVPSNANTLPPPPPPMASAKAKSTFDLGAYTHPISPPQSSYNNAPIDIDEPVVGSAPPTVPTASAAMAVIRCTFIPSMPDELNITNGELVRVLGEYDDGWALVANARGEQGMVPLECLARGSRVSLLEGDRETLHAPDVLRKRETQRLSSLSGISGISQRR